jgi:hypothetical protein
LLVLKQRTQLPGIEHGWMGTLPTSQAAVVCFRFQNTLSVIGYDHELSQSIWQTSKQVNPRQNHIAAYRFLHPLQYKQEFICAKTASLPFLKFFKRKNCQFIYSCCIRSCHLLSSCQMPMPLDIDMSQGFVYKLSLPPDVKST